ncbi:heterokaryon incompatibility protein-domain-containing protein [Xylaria digitata]|nr:heterokaryon incompatibility protein-domain-containing protein [Xylaria digitata]
MAFSYPPLPAGDALRLLTLKAGEFFDPLQGDLVPIAFSARPEYLALSYTWGDPTPDQPKLPAAFIKQADVPSEESDYQAPEKCYREATLALNGHEFPITHNLALALRYLRSASHPLTLWVDAVCINQADIDERNSQVALMALIYSRAAAVVTWLGLNAPEVMGALQTFDQDGGIEAGMAMRDVYRLGNSKELAPWFAEYKASGSGVASRNLPEFRATEEEALQRIAEVNEHGDTMVMATNYWQRVWVVQEVCLARKVLFVYGPTLIVDEEAVRYAHQMQMIKVTKGMDSMLEARKTRFTNTMRLETLIEDFVGQICTEPRDKIYGLIGLANDVNAIEGGSDIEASDDIDEDGASIQDGGGEDVDFIIDYRRSYYDMWCDTVKYLFRSPHYFVPEHLDTDEGELARLRHERLTNVVRFAGLVQNSLQDEVERELAQLPASSASEPNSQLKGPRLFGRHLVPVRGYVAGKIVDLGPSYADFVASFRHQTAWRAKWRKHYRKEPDLTQLREMEENYAAKLLKYGEADIARVAPIREESFVAFRSPDDGPLDDLTAVRSGTSGVQIIDNILTTLSAKGVPDVAPSGKVTRFLGTDYCMGLAPPGTALGDWVIRFWDCDAAIIVRPDDTSDPNSSCVLIGRADVAEVRDRKTSARDTVADEALTRYAWSDGEDKRMDMVMSWHSLQRITASIIT